MMPSIRTPAPNTAALLRREMLLDRIADRPDESEARDHSRTDDPDMLVGRGVDNYQSRILPKPEGDHDQAPLRGAVDAPTAQQQGTQVLLRGTGTAGGLDPPCTESDSLVVGVSARWAALQDSAPVRRWGRGAVRLWVAEPWVGGGAGPRSRRAGQS